MYLGTVRKAWLAVTMVWRELDEGLDYLQV